MSQQTNSQPRAKVIFNLKSDDDVVYYTKYDESLNFDKINAYWGCVQAFQSGSNAGKTKKYKNVDGLLKIESSTWKNPEIPQTPENRRIAENWDEEHKIFISPEVKLNKIKHLKESERLDKHPKNSILITFENVQYVLAEGECIEFGEIDNPKVTISN